MATATIWHNPRCSKSRQTLALLEERGIETNVVEYLVAPPTTAELRDALGKLGVEPAELVRKKELKELGEDVRSLDGEALIHLMTQHPKLIERPVVFVADRAALGRPPEAVLSLLT